MRRTLPALAATAALACPTVAQADARAPGPVTPDAVIQYNRTLLSMLRMPGQQPATVHPTRSMAMTHLAIARAVMRAERLPLGRAARRTSEQAAAAVAGHDVLLGLFPGEQAALNQQEQGLMSGLPSGAPAARGREIGARSAQQEMADRAGDGSGATPPPYIPTGAPGDFAPTPPDVAAPVFTNWGAIRPFVLRSGRQFRPAPPALTSTAYARGLNEVQSLGQDTSPTRSQDQTIVAKFWAAPIQNYWNEIAQTAALARHLSLPEDARMFAALDATVADGVIALYDAKYADRLWRPIAAIRGADSDGNPATTADPAWTPLAKTPADPSYPGAHSDVSSAAARVLDALLRSDRRPFTVASEALPGVMRSFRSFDAAAQEAGLSRIVAGVHTRLDHVAGRDLGRHVAAYDLPRLLRELR